MKERHEQMLQMFWPLFVFDRLILSWDEVDGEGRATLASCLFVMASFCTCSVGKLSAKVLNDLAG